MKLKYVFLYICYALRAKYSKFNTKSFKEYLKSSVQNSLKKACVLIDPFLQQQLGEIKLIEFSWTNSKRIYHYCNGSSFGFIYDEN